MKRALLPWAAAVAALMPCLCARAGDAVTDGSSSSAPASAVALRVDASEPQASTISLIQPTSSWIQDEPHSEPVFPLGASDTNLHAEKSLCDTCCDCQPVLHHIDCDCEACNPHVCRFDNCCVDWPCCTTDKYCPHPCTNCPHGTCRKCDDCCGWVCDSCYCDVYGETDDIATSVLRFGWWAVSSDGSEQKTGEYQDLSPSPFWDFDTIRSDGTRTFDVTASGLDNEANDARLDYYGPNGSGRLRFRRFPHRVDHDPLAGADRRGPLGPADNVVTEDLNVGEDYAIRVQQLDVKFQGKLTDNIKWRLNVWEQRKFGERMANATAHCFDVDPGPATNNVCHVLSQRQKIDWTTVEIQPVVEARFDNFSVEYSRTMRQFGQDDGLVERQYTRFPPFNGPGNTLGPPFPYAVVPENFTQIDRVKLRTELSENSEVYANMYYGDTENFYRDINRQFSGYDARLINRSFDGVTLTAYASLDEENNEFPPFLLPEEQVASVRTQMRHPIDYSRARTGVKGQWQPFCNGCPDPDWSDPWRSLLITSGYEYIYLARDYAVYQTALGTFSQPDTVTNQIDFGPSIRWTPSFENYVRYRVRFIENPLIGVREANGRLNTNQPEQVHSVDVGGTWTPAANFMASAQVTAINSWNDSEIADFTEDNYPFFLTLWYAPTKRWSLTGGYGFYSNDIDQDITLGYRYNVADQTETTRWNYNGEAHVLSLNSAYCLTDDVKLIAGYEWVNGSNVFSVPPSPAGADWSLLPFLSDIDVDTQRWTAGMDWKCLRDMSVYFRYIYFDYNDVASDIDDGTAHTALAGTDYIW